MKAYMDDVYFEGGGSEVHMRKRARKRWSSAFQLKKPKAAAGLMNFVRNVGQSVGTSAVTTLIARRSQYH